MTDRRLTGNHVDSTVEDFGERIPPGVGTSLPKQFDVQEQPSFLLKKLKRSLLRQSAIDENPEDRAMQTELSQAIRNSYSDLGNVECMATTSTIFLYGFVRSYHELQKAIQIVRSIVKDRLISLEVDVIPNLCQQSIQSDIAESNCGERSQVER